MKIFKNKKGDESGGGIGTMRVIILTIIVVAIVVLILRKPTSGFSAQALKTQVQQKIDSCKLEYDIKVRDGNPIADKDGDGLLDSCDPCPDIPQSGSNVKDEDNDNFPVWIEPTKKDKTPQEQFCCVKGADSNKVNDHPEEYCETQDNDKKLGPNKLILAYLT